MSFFVFFFLFLFVFFFNDTATTEIYTLSLHDALPICIVPSFSHYRYCTTTASVNKAFDEVGLLLFTLRNGSAADLKLGKGKLYAEKVMIVHPGQVTPMHLHWSKTEDIINRGGSRLVLQLYEADEHGEPSEADVCFSSDGVSHRMPAGCVVSLSPGESITLTPGLYHTFWSEDAAVLVGEVSTVNDDDRDNRFRDPIGRFPAIEEDEPPLHFLVGDYPSLAHPRSKPAASGRT